MSVTIIIPTALRQFTGGKSEVIVESKNVGNALDQLTTLHSGLKKHLFNEQNALRNFVNIYVNDEDIRYQSGTDTPVSDGSSISIIPSIAGGSPSTAFIELEQPTKELPELSNEEISRYSRHLILPEVGIEGQRKIKNARVLMVGTGGLGAPLGMYLAAAGVGHLGIVDFDTVDSSNLQRQIIHGTRDVGRLKIRSAEDRLHDINPNVDIETYDIRLSSENALEIIKEYDIIVDGTDNFPTRYLVNDACVLLNKPNVYGSIFRFEGQASVFWAQEGACYRCLYSEPPPPGLVPSCAEGGVLGVLPGIIGTIQANETIKLILGSGEPLINRLLLFDAWKLKFRELKLHKNPSCPICGEHPSIHELIDYEAFCGLNIPEAETNIDTDEITAVEFKKWIDQGLNLQIIDVREPFEYDIAKIPNSTLIPLGQITDRVSEIDPSKISVFLCKVGFRSAKAISRLKEIGFKGQLTNLKGGINAWSNDVDASVPKY
jgi:adenylyltransferase/sulfurtransferase